MLKRPKIRVRKDLTEDQALDAVSILHTPKHSAPMRKVILHTISEDVLMNSQETEPDCDMVSVASTRIGSINRDKRSRLRSGSDIMETDECSESSLKAWAAACRNEADAAMVFAELEEERARTAAALASEALIKANKLAVAAEQARRKAAVACKEAKAAKISAKEAADFALKSLDAATKAEEASVAFHTLQT